MTNSHKMPTTECYSLQRPTTGNANTATHAGNVSILGEINAVLRKCVGYFSSSNSYDFSTDTNISGVGGRIGISGCRSLPHSVVGI